MMTPTSSGEYEIEKEADESSTVRKEGNGRVNERSISMT